MKKIILLFSLFFVVGVHGLDTRPFDKNDPYYTSFVGLLDEKMLEAESLLYKHSKIQRKSEKRLLLTEEGQAYENALSDKSDDKHALKQLALKKLQEKQEYKDIYLPAITSRDHYFFKVECLRRMRNSVAYQSERYGSEEKAMLAGLDLMANTSGTPSTYLLDSTNDFDKTQMLVRQELRHLVAQIFPTAERTTPEYQ